MINKIKNLLEKTIDIEDIDLESNFIELPLRHFKYELNKSTPFTWSIKANDERKTIVIKINIDKRALSNETDIESLVLNSIKYNDMFKELVNSLAEFEPDNQYVKDLYNMDKYKKQDKKNIITYIKTVRFGV